MRTKQLKNAEERLINVQRNYQEMEDVWWRFSNEILNIKEFMIYKVHGYSTFNSYVETEFPSTNLAAMLKFIESLEIAEYLSASESFKTFSAILGEGKVSAKMMKMIKEESGKRREKYLKLKRNEIFNHSDLNDVDLDDYLRELELEMFSLECNPPHTSSETL